MATTLLPWSSWLESAKILSLDNSQPSLLAIDAGDSWKFPLVLLMVLVLSQTNVVRAVCLLPLFFLSTPAKLIQYVCWVLIWNSNLHDAYSFGVSIAITILAIQDSRSLGLIPSILCVLWLTPADSKGLPVKSAVIFISIVAVCYWQCSLVQNIADLSFLPSFGVLWYFKAVVLSDFRSYFEKLIPILQVIAPVAGSLCVGNPMGTEGAVKIALLLDIYFRENVALNDVIFLVSEVLANGKILKESRYILWLVTVIAVSLALCPWLYDEWVITGRGNANYLFFSCFASWVALGVFIVEILSASIRIEENIAKSVSSQNPR